LKILKKFNLPAIKVGSDDFVNVELIKSYLKFNKPLILSTGMSRVEDFKNILRIKGISTKKIIFLLCTSEYPTKHKNVNIKKIYSIKNIIGNHLIGFSDHTKDNLASVMALSHGCCFFEKHFTLNNNLLGPDHSFSCNPKQLKSWVDAIKNAYKCMGSAKIEPTKKEKKNKENFQRKIIAKKFIQRGQVIKDDDVILLRTLNKKALPANELLKVIGRKSKNNIAPGSPIYL
jgi:sialic acid synthase SpsE